MLDVEATDTAESVGSDGTALFREFLAERGAARRARRPVAPASVSRRMLALPWARLHSDGGAGGGSRSGTFGLGMQLDGCTVRAVRSGGVAATAGVVPGMRIVAVGGRPAAATEMAIAAQLEHASQAGAAAVEVEVEQLELQQDSLAPVGTHFSAPQAPRHEDRPPAGHTPTWWQSAAVDESNPGLAAPMLVNSPQIPYSMTSCSS